MSSPNENLMPGAVATDEHDEARHYSKDYWDLVFEQLGRRALFKVGMVVLTLLYGVSVFAPLLANDKPYVIEAVDLDEYASNVRLLGPTATGAHRVSRQSDEEYAASIEGKDAAAPNRGIAVAIEWNAAQERLEKARRFLRGEDLEPLVEFETSFSEGAQAFGLDDDFMARLRRADVFEARDEGESVSYPDWGGPVDPDTANDRFDAAKKLGRSFRRGMTPWDPAQPDKEGVELVGQKSQPLKESLRPWEVGLMAFWILWAAWPVWNWVVNTFLLWRNRERIRRARRWKALGVLALSIAAAFGWRVTVGAGAQELDTSPYKTGLADGTMYLVAEGRTLREAAEDDSARGRVVWAPVTYGYSETHLVEKFRVPTWIKGEAEIDPETGRYLHPKWAPEKDPITGDFPASTPLDIRAGEPDANDWDRHIAGTDELGRDFFGRMIWGSRVSLSVGIVSAFLLTVIGVIMGSLAGFFGGWVDVAIMRLIEILQSIPAFFLILLAMAFTDPDTVPPMLAIVVVIAIVRWTGVARLVRGEFLRLREQEFVVAARALGFSSSRTIFRHVLPNALSPVLVAAAFSVAAGILTESAISFLGFGVRPPEASWGSLVNESKNPTHWWIQVFPGFLIFVTVTCYNLVGDAVRDALDPKMKV